MARRREKHLITCTECSEVDFMDYHGPKKGYQPPENWEYRDPQGPICGECIEKVEVPSAQREWWGDWA